MIQTEQHPQFFTATIVEWKHLLSEDNYKEILLDSLRFLAREKRVVINSFVIMSNHIHLIWQVINGFTPQQVQHSFLKFTAQQIKYDLQKSNPQLLESFRVNAKDREFQFWERNALCVDLFSEEVYNQKLNFCPCWCCEKQHAEVVSFDQPHKYGISFAAESPHFTGDVWQR